MKRCCASLLPGSIAVVLVSCSTPQYSPLSSPAPATPVVTAAPAVPRETEPAPAPEVVTLAHEAAPVIGLDNVEMGGSAPTVSLPATPVPLTSPAPVKTRPTPLSFGDSWIPLRQWTERCALGAAERSVSGGTTTYRMSTRGGIAKIIVGSRLAQWNGTPVWLGFAPRIIQGEPCIHGLDADKTLLPLSMFSATSKSRARTVVLDPGHGGSDSGTRGARSELEKSFSLDWALRTERMLTNAGWKVFLTRRADVDVSLAERVAVADRVRADLFISLHFNSTFPQTQPSGIETYCVTPVGMPSTLARGYADDERAAFPNNAFDAANLDWAFRIHNAVVAETRAHDDGIKRARFMSVLRYQKRPAVLVEGGFLSNAQDAANIHSAAYREALARALAEALK